MFFPQPMVCADPELFKLSIYLNLLLVVVVLGLVVVAACCHSKASWAEGRVEGCRFCRREEAREEVREEAREEARDLLAPNSASSSEEE